MQRQRKPFEVHQRNARSSVRYASASRTHTATLAPARQPPRLPARAAVSAASSSRLDFEARQLSEVVRASVHVYNTEGEVEVLLAAVAALACHGDAPVAAPAPSAAGAAL